MEGEEGVISRDEQVSLFVFFKSEIVFIGLSSIKILPMEIRLISIPYSSQNTKKVEREGWERRLEKEGGLEGELGKSSGKLGAGASPGFTALPSKPFLPLPQPPPPQFGCTES